MQPERAVFLATAFATHGAVGYALVFAFTDADARLGAAVALAPDVDFLFPASWGLPLVHRGIMHAPAVGGAILGGVYALRRRRADVAWVALALGSHLALDALSPKGIPLLFPFGTVPTPGLPVHGPMATALLWSLVGWLLAGTPDVSGLLNLGSG
jgi:inner membrane protein